MSFIDRMANDRWSDADITKRTEAMVRSVFPAEAEGIINRKLQGAGLGQYTLTPEDGAEIARFNDIVTAAAIAGAQARADALLVNQALEMEALFRELAAIPDDEEHYDQRQAVQAAIDAFPQEAEALVIERADYRAAQEPQETQQEVLP